MENFQRVKGGIIIIMKNETTVINAIPKCDVCGKPAMYDAKTIHGPWAYLCQNCFKEVGVGLGLGKGQKIITDRTK